MGYFFIIKKSKWKYKKFEQMIVQKGLYEKIKMDFFFFKKKFFMRNNSDNYF